MTHKIYKHVCPNGKVYIGVSINPKGRWGKNGICYGKTSRFAKAIEEFGWKNIQHIVAKGTYTQERAYELEIKLIAKYNSTNENFGYNRAIGGKGNYGVIHSDNEKNNIRIGQQNSDIAKEHVRKLHEMHKGMKRSEESKKRMSEAQKGKKQTQEHIRNAAKGHIGLKRSEETKRKMSETHKKRCALLKEEKEGVYNAV